MAGRQRFGCGAVLDAGLGFRNWLSLCDALFCRFLDEFEGRLRRSFFTEFLRDDVLQLDHFGFRSRGRRSGFIEINLRESELGNFSGFRNWRGLRSRCRLGFERRRGFFGNHELSRWLSGSSLR